LFYPAVVPEKFKNVELGLIDNVVQEIEQWYYPDRTKKEGGESKEEKAKTETKGGESKEEKAKTETKKEKNTETEKKDKKLRLEDKYMTPGIFRHAKGTDSVDLRVILNRTEVKAKPILIPISAKFREEGSKGTDKYTFDELFGNLEKSLKIKNVHDKFDVIYCFVTNELVSQENKLELQKSSVMVISQDEINYFCPIFAKAFPRNRINYIPNIFPSDENSKVLNLIISNSKQTTITNFYEKK